MTCNNVKILHEIDNSLDKICESLTEDYKYIHSHPELSDKEVGTAQYVRSRLEQYGYDKFEEIASLPTSVVAVLDSGRPGPVVCYRAELDAIRRTESTGLLYASTTEGTMHSCGHDAHASILIGVAYILNSLKKFLSGKIVFLFQPAEETGQGAKRVLESGLLHRLAVDHIYTLHVAPQTPVGCIQLSSGFILAGNTGFEVTVKGAGSHAAYPHHGNDVLVATADIVAGLTRLPARRFDIANRPCVISVAYLEAGDRRHSNTLADTATFKGTVRSFENIFDLNGFDAAIAQTVENYLDTYAATLGVVMNIKWKKGVPPVHNNPKLYESTKRLLDKCWAKKDIIEHPKFMSSDDFGYFSSVLPSLYFGLGIAKQNLGAVGVHSEYFTIHLDSLRMGVRLLTVLSITDEEVL